MYNDLTENFSGNAKLAGLVSQLNLVGNRYNIALVSETLRRRDYLLISVLDHVLCGLLYSTKFCCYF